MHGRHRLGDRTLYMVYGPLRQRRHGRDVRGRARLAGQGPVLGDHREVRRHDLLHRAHGDPRVHEMGRRAIPAGTTSRSCACWARVGEPINPEAWMWYHEHIGGERCPIVDTWWQTETGGIMITPLPGVTTTKPGIGHRRRSRASMPSSGRGGQARAGSAAATSRSPARGPGCCAPSGATTSATGRPTGASGPDVYFPGDGAKRDEDGYFWILGRVDDVLNVAGHRIGTMEVESALVDHPAVAEAAVVGTTRRPQGAGDRRVRHAEGRARADRRAARGAEGPRGARRSARLRGPTTSCFTADLPKTRSGKIMRRLLKDIAEGRALGDTTTLADPAVVEAAQDPVRGGGVLAERRTPIA